MTTAKTKLLTADDLLRLHSKGVKGELIRGVLAETVATGVEHGKIAAKYTIRLGIFVEPRKLGTIVTSDSGVWVGRNPDTVREPDVAFTSAERMPLDIRVPGYADVPPDLVVEIVSPSDSAQDVAEKITMWLNLGVSIALEVRPAEQAVLVHRPDVPAATLSGDDVLDCGDVLPGFTLPLGEVFDP